MVEWVSRGLDVLCFDANKKIVKQSIQVTYYKDNTVLATTQYTTRGANESYLMPVAVGTNIITFINPYLVDCSNNGGAKVEKIEGGWKISNGAKIIDANTMSGFSVYFTYSPTTTPTTSNALTIRVINVNTGNPIKGLGVYLFSGSGGVEPPEKANYTAITNDNGIATFIIPSGFYRVLVSSENGKYIYADKNMSISSQWLNTYSCMSAVGFPQVTTLDIPLIEKTPTTTTTTPTTTISSGGGGGATTTITTTPATTEEKGVFEIIKPYLPYIVAGLIILLILAIILGGEKK